MTEYKLRFFFVIADINANHKVCIFKLIPLLPFNCICKINHLIGTLLTFDYLNSSRNLYIWKKYVQKHFFRDKKLINLLFYY